jgi:hypothetical protein
MNFTSSWLEYFFCLLGSGESLEARAVSLGSFVSLWLHLAVDVGSIYYVLFFLCPGNACTFPPLNKGWVFFNEHNSEFSFEFAVF